MRKTVASLGLVSLLALSAPAYAQWWNQPTGFQAGDIMVRLRADGVLPQNMSSNLSRIGGKIDASDTVIPELDLSYFFTPHISVEAIAGTSRHNIWANDTALGTVKVGSVWVLPPTVTVQYHFGGMGNFVPYVGAGVSLMLFYDSHTAADLQALGLDTVTYRTGIGPAIEAGFDYHLKGNWYANFVVKQTFVATRASIGHGTVIAHTNLDPTIVGAGIGYRF
ncbi:MAG: outer membrane beta-barrel protein [Acidiphilium sp.]|nr:outer membrane beta-barrel protein [Acidiphilium sp.]MDD4935920.1 outer membrane beta-barrel protein [Acidiphilium sp.]